MMIEDIITVIDNTFQIHCPREDLLLALQVADAVVPNNSANPIMNNLKLKVHQNRLEIFATDSQVGLRAIVRRIEADQDGQVIIPAKQLAGILKESSSSSVQLYLNTEKDHQLLMVKLSDGDYNLPIIAGSTFPNVSDFPNQENVLSLAGNKLDRMIKQTSFAVDRDRTSAVLSGVFISCRDDELILAATDGKVLAESVDKNESYANQEEFQAIIPTVTIGHLSRILSSHSSDVDISVYKKIIFIRSVIGGGEGGSGTIQIELSSRLVEGTYPAYRNAIATRSETTVQFKTKDLTSAVRRTALLTSAASRGIVVNLSAHEAVLNNLNHTSGVARIPVKCNYNGPDIRLGMNAHYLSEVLKVLSDDDCTIELNGTGKGMIIRNESCCFLIMPITLPN